MKTSDLFGRPLTSGQRSTLGKRFRWPPFSVLNTRDGDWQNRKRAWISIGIKSELGRGEALTWDDGVHDIDAFRHKEAGRAKAQSYRMDEYIDDYRPKANALPGGSKRPLARGYAGELTDRQQKEKADEIRRNNKANATPGGSAMPAMNYSQNKARGDGRGRPMFHAQPGGGPSQKSVWLGSKGKPVGGEGAINATGDEGQISQSGTSVFDPVVCELVYRWFSPSGGTVLDPFAGGSVRGIVASVLGRDYVGLDLRREQIAANRIQGETICDPGKQPIWLEGDSRGIDHIVLDEMSEDFWADMVFSCPPYFDLELYSNDERDLSNTDWETFLHSYYRIIKRSTSLMKPNRFAAFVVGDLRDKSGNYRNLPGETVQCFQEAGLKLYNQLVLVTAVGSLPLRVGQQFTKNKKVGFSHQYIYVFHNGEGNLAAAATEDPGLISLDWKSSD